MSEIEKLIGELSIGVIKTKRKQEQYEVRMELHHNSKYIKKSLPTLFSEITSL